MVPAVDLTPLDFFTWASLDPVPIILIIAGVGLLVLFSRSSAS